jgi:hypothetical protein
VRFILKAIPEPQLHFGSGPERNKKKMFVRFTLAICVLMILAVVPAFAAAGDGCKKGNWTGSYTSLAEVGNKYAIQLNFGADGAVSLYQTVYPERMIYTGTGTTGYGVWKCRADGKIVMTALYANFRPDGFDDLTLAGHQRVTLLLEVVDGNTLKRTAFVYRNYEPFEDPTDPAGGTLGTPGVGERIYTRVTVSEGDLP